MNRLLRPLFTSSAATAGLVRPSRWHCPCQHWLSMDSTGGQQKTGKVAKLTDEERAQLLDPLLSRDWKLANGRDAICKSYKFKNFQQAFSFMTSVALNAEKFDHHPEWSNVYGRVDVTFTTHSCGGLSAKDVKLAGIADKAAAAFDVKI